MMVVCRIPRCLGVSHEAGHIEEEDHGCLRRPGREKDGISIRGVEREGRERVPRGC